MRKAILASVAIFFLHTVAVAAKPEVYSNCFEIVAGDYPTLVFMQNRDVQIRIESYATDAPGWWTVSDASITGNIVFASCEVGSRIVTANLGNGFNHFSKDFSPREEPIFRFAFRWECRVPSGQREYYAGWVSLIVNSANEPVVYGCEVSRYISEPVMGRGEPAHLYAEVSFRTIDHGDWLELDTQCVPEDTEGWIVIPPEIDGKPIRAIRRYAFRGCRRLTRITIPDTIESIGACAFAECLSLSELELPSSVTNVGARIVAGCASLGEIRIGGGALAFGRSAFASTSIAKLVIGSGVTRIDHNAFVSNPNLKTVTIPPSVALIARNSFQGCGSLKSVSIPWGTVVEDGAFPSDCVITRDGPDMLLSAVIDKDDVDTKSSLMRTLDWHDYESKESVRFCEGYPPFSDAQDKKERRFF